MTSMIIMCPLTLVDTLIIYFQTPITDIDYSLKLIWDKL